MSSVLLKPWSNRPLCGAFAHACSCHQLWMKSPVSRQCTGEMPFYYTDAMGDSAVMQRWKDLSYETQVPSPLLVFSTLDRSPLSQPLLTCLMVWRGKMMVVATVCMDQRLSIHKDFLCSTLSFRQFVLQAPQPCTASAESPNASLHKVSLPSPLSLALETAGQSGGTSFPSHMNLCPTLQRLKQSGVPGPCSHLCL